MKRCQNCRKNLAIITVPVFEIDQIFTSDNYKPKSYLELCWGCLTRGIICLHNSESKALIIQKVLLTKKQKGDKK